MSLAEKAALRPFLEAWRGRAFSPDELASFNLVKLAGAFGFGNVVHALKNGSTFANLANVSPLPKAMPKPEGVNPVQVFDLDAPDPNVWETLSERLQAAILQSPEGQKWMFGERNPSQPAASAPPQPTATPEPARPAPSYPFPPGKPPKVSAADFGDDIPF